MRSCHDPGMAVIHFWSPGGLRSMLCLPLLPPPLLLLQQLLPPLSAYGCLQPLPAAAVCGQSGSL